MDQYKKFDLKPLLSPKSIAMLGASEKNFFSMMIFENLKKEGYAGKVFPINPKYSELAGHTCYPSLKELPEAPDTVIIMTRRDLVLNFVKDCIAIGAKSAVIISAGFRETKEPEWVAVEDEIRELAYAHSFPICGPNCLGIFNIREHVATMAAPIRGGAVPGHVGLVMQSGGMMLGLSYPCYQRRIGLSCAVSIGNSTILDCSDYIEYLVEDEETKVICAFVEGIRKPQKFEAAAKKALKAGKPIILLKTGVSARGTRSTMAHTASVAGNPDVNNAIFDKYGIVRVNDFEELLEAASVFSKTVESGMMPKAPGMCIISASGGSVGLLSDLSERLDVSIPELLPETQAKLLELFPAGAFVCNPVDATGQILNDLAAYRKALEIIKEDPQIGLVVSFETVGFPGNDTLTHKKRLLNTVEMCKELNIPLVSCSLNSHSLDEWQCSFLTEEKNISLVQGAGKVLCAVSGLLKYAEFMRSCKDEPEYTVDNDKKAKAVALIHAAKNKALDAGACEHLLGLYGLKAEKAVGNLEFSVNAFVDGQFGAAVTIGLGGAYANIVKDKATVIAPAKQAEIAAVLKKSKVCRTLGNQEINSISVAVAALSELIYALKDEVASATLDISVALGQENGVKVCGATVVSC